MTFNKGGKAGGREGRRGRQEEKREGEDNFNTFPKKRMKTLQMDTGSTSAGTKHDVVSLAGLYFEANHSSW